MSRFALKQSILKRAVRENRGYEAILLIQWRTAAATAKSQQEMETVRQFERENRGQARSVCMLNLHAEREGQAVRYNDNAIVPTYQPSAILN